MTLKKRYWLVPLIILGTVFGLWYFLSHFNGMSSVQLGEWLIEMRTATLLGILILATVMLYIVVSLIMSLPSWRLRLRHQRAKQELTQGLMALAEGQWKRSEKLLLKRVEYSEAPLINYLAASRSAHMDNRFERRDELLKQAIAHNPKAAIAVGVSQADMQVTSKQWVQAHATLQHLRQKDAKNPFILKLYARTLLKQKQWDELLELLPQILKSRLFSKEDLRGAQNDILSGIFQHQIKLGGLEQLIKAWESLPNLVHRETTAKILYAQALKQAGGHQQCTAFIESHLEQSWNDTLIQVYSELEHTDSSHTQKQLELWLQQQPNNPHILLALARLNKQQQLWGLAKHYYEASLNQAPNTVGYLELAELLEELGETEAALLSYRTGLRFGTRKQAEHLNLSAL